MIEIINIIFVFFIFLTLTFFPINIFNPKLIVNTLDIRSMNLLINLSICSARLNDWIKQEGDVAKNVIRKANEKTRSGRIQKRHGLTHKMNKDGFKDSEWSNEERIHVGVRIISVIIETTGIVELKKFTNGRGKLTFYVIATPKTLDWIKDFNQVAEVSRPRYTPTIIPPKDWDRVWGGGYFANVINNLPLVRVH